jgi:hypothetical protein
MGKRGDVSRAAVHSQTRKNRRRLFKRGSEEDTASIHVEQARRLDTGQPSAAFVGDRLRRFSPCNGPTKNGRRAGARNER